MVSRQGGHTGRRISRLEGLETYSIEEEVNLKERKGSQNQGERSEVVRAFIP